MKRTNAWLIGCFLFSSVSSFPQTWNGSQNSEWNNPANWTPATVPGPAGTVTLNNAAAPNQPRLSGNVSIGALGMSAGILDLNGFILACTGNASLSGDSLLNGKIVASHFPAFTNMRLGGKLTIEKTGAANAFWDGGLRAHGDSILIIWRSGALHMESATADSFFTPLQIELANDYSVYLAGNASLFVQGNLILKNTGNGIFAGGASQPTKITGSLVGLGFTLNTPNLLLRNITTEGAEANGPFLAHTATLANLNFAGDFSLVADSSVTISVTQSAFLGANNLIQAGSFDFTGNRFGRSGEGLTIIRAAHNVAGNVYLRGGNNIFFGNVQYQTYARYPGGLTIQQTFYGADSCMENLLFQLKENVSLTTNSAGASYVGGDLIIDAMGHSKWVQFTGGTGVSFTVHGNFRALNFTAVPESGVTYTNIHLRNLFVEGDADGGQLYGYGGDISNCRFNGSFWLTGDSSQTYSISSSTFNGTNNYFQAGSLDFHDNRFGQPGGQSVFNAAHNVAGSVYMRDGSNRFYGDAEIKTYALYPGGLTIQQTFYGADSCFGNMTYTLKGNAALTTNGAGHSYVAGDLVIDAQDKQKWVQFTGGSGVSMNVMGNLYFRNFKAGYETGIVSTNIHLRNLYVEGNDSSGTAYAYTGDILNCRLNGSLRLLVDSSQSFLIQNSQLLGNLVYIQSGNLEYTSNHFGNDASAITHLRATPDVAGSVYVREGSNVFNGDAEIETVSTVSSILLQEGFYGADSVRGDLVITLNGNSSASVASDIYLNGALKFYNYGSGSINLPGGLSAIHFTGSDTATYVASGGGSAPVFGNVEINRQGGLRLLSPMPVLSTIKFTKGIVVSSDGAPLQLLAGSSVLSAWDSSYVDGPVLKTGNTAFTFPLGRANHYAPMSITSPAAPTDQFSARYFDHPAVMDGYDSSAIDPVLHHISRKEYWVLNRLTGTASVRVTLSWDIIRSGTVTEPADLRIARWNGSSWINEGANDISGSAASGTLQTANAISSFSPFTLASVSAANALPVYMEKFSVQLQNAAVRLNWVSTGSGSVINYEVQRSFDSKNWTTVTVQPYHGAGPYEAMDYSPATGINYYRIHQVGIEELDWYSPVRIIKMAGASGLQVWPNPAIDNLYISGFDPGSDAEIRDVQGRMVWRGRLETPVAVLPVNSLRPGIYQLVISGRNGRVAVRFIKGS